MKLQIAATSTLYPPPRAFTTHAGPRSLPPRGPPPPTVVRCAPADDNSRQEPEAELFFLSIFFRLILMFSFEFLFDVSILFSIFLSLFSDFVIFHDLGVGRGMGSSATGGRFGRLIGLLIAPGFGIASIFAWFIIMCLHFLKRGRDRAALPQIQKLGPTDPGANQRGRTH